MRTTCHKIPAPVSQVHLSLEFECPTPGIVELLPGKGKFQQSAKSVPAAAAFASDTETALSLPALFSFIYESFPLHMFGEHLQYLTPVIKDSVKPLFPKQKLGEWTILKVPSIQLPVSSTFLLDIYAHCSKPFHCVFLSHPVFLRPGKAAFRQIGRMSMESDVELTVTISWV